VIRLTSLSYSQQMNAHREQRHPVSSEVGVLAPAVMQYGALPRYPAMPVAQHTPHAPSGLYQNVAIRKDVGTNPSRRHSPTGQSATGNIRQNTAPTSRHSPSGQRRVSRGVDVSNLPTDLPKSEVAKIFARIGPIQSDSLKIRRDSHSRSSRGTIAQAIFKSARDASTALRELDGKVLWGKPVFVVYNEAYEMSFDAAGGEQDDRRAARDDSPLVVDGARGSRHKRDEKESDDESEESSGEEGVDGELSCSSC
jgi:RNA recognition motif. (a.k.a. RRM, RBD, or RNP domain)